MAARKSARERILETIARRKNPQTAKELAEAVCGTEAKPHKNPAIKGKYAIANARKVVYAMVRDGELDRNEDDHTVTLAS